MRFAAKAGGAGVRVLLLALLATTTLSACTPGTCIDPARLSYQITREGDLHAGRKSTVLLDIINRSNRFMLVEEIGGKAIPANGANSFVGPEPGSLTRGREGRAWYYNPLAQQETQPLFSRGLIPPGRRLRVQVEIQPEAEEGTFDVRYRGLTIEQAANRLFLPEDGKEATVKYIHWQKSRLTEAARVPAEGQMRDKDFNLIVVDPDLAKEGPSCTVQLPYKLLLK